MNIFSVTDKVIVVTGATGELGGSMANHLVSQNAKIVILARNKELIDIKVESLKSKELNVIGVTADVTSEEDLNRAKSEIIASFGRIDGLINAAGGNTKEAVVMPEDSVFDMNMNAFDKVFDLNLKGTVLPTMVFGSEIAKNKGSIINISSVAAHSALTRVAGYSAAKAAVENFTKWMGSELALRYGDQIRMNAIAPGFFVAKQNKSLLLNDDGSYTKRGEKIINRTPMGRFGNSKELFGAAQWLLSDASSFVTGAVIPIDGGYGAYSGI
jgi:NAD(P)-dependent dehydrogenase (short-subunit alcohol dehydrogenase family)